MKLSKKSLIILLTLITVVGAVIRLYKLGDIPWALNRDEASIGYNAYSLLKTGKEEHGAAWPINVESFGDWKLPVYIYTSIPFIAAFGLEAWVVRLPSALAGIVLIPAVYFFVVSWKKKPTTTEYTVALASALFVALSPWSLRLSRVAYEANVALVLATIGVSCIVKGLVSKKSWLIPVGTFVSLLTLLTYHTYQVFMPLLLLSLVFIFWEPVIQTIRSQKLIALMSGVIAVIFIGLLILGNTAAANTTKFNGLSIFSETTYHFQLFERRMSFKNPTGLVAKLYANSVVMITENIYKNVSAILSTNFLLLNGGSHGSHDVKGIGNVALPALILSLVAIAMIISKIFKQKASLFEKAILIWFILSFVAPVITVEAAHSIRFSPAIVAFAVLAGYGLTHTVQQFSVKRNLVFLGVGAIMLCYSVVQTLGTYFVIFPQRDHQTWPWYSTQLSADIQELKIDYKKVIMPQVDSSPYIFLLFDWKYDPKDLSTELSFYPTDEGGFKHAQRLENVFFEPMDWQAFTTAFDPELVFIEKKEFEKQNLQSGDYSIVKKYESNNAATTFYLISNQ